MIDDDSYLFINRLIYFLTKLDHTKNLLLGDYCNWNKLKPNNPNKYRWPGGGPGIIFTQKSAKTYFELGGKYLKSITNHDCWLNDIYKIEKLCKIVQRVHIPYFFQYIPKNMNIYDNSIISLHFSIRKKKHKKFDILKISNFYNFCIKYHKKLYELNLL